MLKPIKTFYAGNLPTLEDWQEAVKIAKEENCVVQVTWYPNLWAGYYHVHLLSRQRQFSDQALHKEKHH